MARKNTPDEKATRREMTDAYQRQEGSSDGYDDWGMFTAHVVCEQRNEIERLTNLLRDSGADSGTWPDPLKA